MDNKRLRNMLLEVEKPARYMGGEFNMPDMDKPCDVRVCLCFPDLYEVGMSNIGLRILYHMLNEKEGVVCERCYAPAADMAAKMRENGIPLFSVDTKRDLKDFDIVGFSVQFELLYSNILYMLDLAGIPFKACDRGEEYPIIVAGGPCSVNPEPYADFFDLILVGEGEVNLDDLTEQYRIAKAAGVRKSDFIASVNGRDGIFAPSLMRPIYGEDGKTVGFTGMATRSVCADLDKAYFPTRILVPNIEIVHDRAVLELYRGCANGCRFCQACFFYRPIRERKKDTLVKYAAELIKYTGYNEISLSSLSTGDYGCLSGLLDDLAETLGKETKLSLPSLRLDSFEGKFTEGGRKGSLTFAPEAGTQRLRDVINKNITDEDIDKTLQIAAKRGYKGVKLYFMLGLPTETQEDVEGIVEIVKRAKEIFREYGDRSNRFARISVSTSVFIPKPLTPFQWARQIGMEEMYAKQRYLKDALKIKDVSYSWHDSKTSVIEAVFARGDRRLADAIVSAYEKGCKFDSWSEYFDYDRWIAALEENGVCVEDYLKERDIEEVLPWDHIDNGVTKEYLAAELENAYAGRTTPSCAKGCRGCGANKLGKCYV